MLTALQPDALDSWSPEAFAEALAKSLLEQGALDAHALERAHLVARESGGRLDTVLTRLGLVSDGVVAVAMAELLGLRVAAPQDYPDAPILKDRLRPKFLHKARAVPISLDEQTIVAAMVDPLDRFARNAIAIAAARDIEVRVALPIDLEAAFDRLYEEDEHRGLTAVDDLGSASVAEDDAERLKDLASEAPLIRLVNQLISQAVEARASDIHIDPLEDKLRVRYRYDGVWHQIEAPPRRLHAAITSRIKIMAMLDIAERRLPQDGRIKLVVRGNEIDLRVSTIPALHGESVVLRILDRTAVSLDFGKLGLAQSLRKTLTELLELPNGIVLVTGPTGSGKTTTLYTGLTHLNSTERNIITVEDPIEYQLPGITQIQVKPMIGLNFASLLRAILRHAPDIIMIGEIRDLETGQIAVQAALTGHLVLSTLHTNSAAATIARLRDMGLEDYLLTATLNAVMAQRLVRRLCPQCKRETLLGNDVIDQLGLEHREADGPIRVFEPVGCKSCRGTGYSGRVAVAELLVPNEEIRHLILARAGNADIQKAACANGMRPMYDDGLRHVMNGTTSINEVLRSVRLEG